MQKDEQTPMRVAYERRNRDLDPQLVWRGKDEQDWSRSRGPCPAALHPGEGPPQGADRRPAAQTAARQAAKPADSQLDLFADFNGLPRRGAKTEFYQHDAALVQPHDPGRQLAGDGQPGRARRAARQGAVHLHRSALRHQVQLAISSGQPPAAM